MAEVVPAILKDPYVELDLVEVDKVPLRKAPGNVGIVDVELHLRKVLREIWST